MKRLLRKEVNIIKFLIMAAVVMLLFYFSYQYKQSSTQKLSKFKIALFNHVLPSDERKEQLQIAEMVVSWDGKVIEPARVCFSEDLKLFTYTFNGYVKPRNRVLYDKKKQFFYFGDYGEDPNVKVKINWTTLVIFRHTSGIKYRLKNKLYNIIRMFGLKYYGNSTFTDFSPDGKTLLTNHGLLFDIEKSDGTLAKKASNCIDSCFLKKGLLLLNSRDQNYRGSEPIYQVTLCNESGTQNKSSKNFGNTGKRRLGKYPWSSWVSVSKSPDEKVIAILDPEYDKLYIRLVSARNLKTQGIIKLKQLPEEYTFFEPQPIMEWTNGPKKRLIAEYDTYRKAENKFKTYPENIHEDYTFTPEHNNILIIDPKKKKIIDEIKFNHDVIGPGGYVDPKTEFDPIADKQVVSLRWSPDNQVLGILVNSGNYFKKKSYEGELYIYNIKSRKLTKLMNCPDCFDFHFVE